MCAAQIQPLAAYRGKTSEFYEADGLGSITSLTTTAGAVNQTYVFDSFGNTSSTTGTFTQPFRFTGREYDSETGLYYYRARYYDPRGGRFFSEDPVGFDTGINFYVYVNNRPLTLVDPLGLQQQSPIPPPVQQQFQDAMRAGYLEDLWRRCKCPNGYRSPGNGGLLDFISANVNVAIPNPLTLSLVGVTISGSLDRNGKAYLGLGPNVGKSATLVSGSLTANYLNKDCKPTPKELNDFLTSHSFNGGAGFWGGGQGGWTPGSGTSSGAGFVTPQAGVGYTYSKQVHQFKIHW